MTSSAKSSRPMMRFGAVCWRVSLIVVSEILASLAHWDGGSTNWSAVGIRIERGRADDLKSCGLISNQTRWNVKLYTRLFPQFRSQNRMTTLASTPSHGMVIASHHTSRLVDACHWPSTMYKPGTASMVERRNPMVRSSGLASGREAMG